MINDRLRSMVGFAAEWAALASVLLGAAVAHWLITSGLRQLAEVI